MIAPMLDRCDSVSRALGEEIVGIHNNITCEPPPHGRGLKRRGGWLVHALAAVTTTKEVMQMTYGTTAQARVMSHRAIDPI